MWKTYSTKEAAAKLGIHRVTLQNWVSAGKVRPSQQIGMNGGKHWRWTEPDIKKVEKYMKKHFGEGQGQRNDLERKNARKGK